MKGKINPTGCAEERLMVEGWANKEIKRWAASGMNHSFRVMVEGFVIEKVVVVGSVQFEI